jgi:membrane protein required for beta-lactamase induction
LVVLAASVLLLITLAFVLITLLKGKIWMGLLALFVPVLSVVAVVGAVRLARPHSPWARWRYHGGQRARQKMTLAQRRERRYQQQPLGRLVTRLQNLVAGRPDKPSPGD